MEPDGRLLAAHAGHLAPYLNGRELSPDLPVDVAPEAGSAEAAQQWGQNDDITVVTVRRTNA